MSKNKTGVVVGVLIFLLSSGLGFSGEGGTTLPEALPPARGKNKPVSLPVKKEFSLIVTDGNTLRVKIQKVPLMEVLQALANQTDLLIEVDQSAEDEFVSAEFDPLPLEEGIQRLLRNKNYVLMYTEVPSLDGSTSLIRVEGIKVAGVGKIGGSPLPPLRRESDRGEVPPMLRHLEDEASRDPQTNKAAIPDASQNERRGIIYGVPSRETSPNVTNPAVPRMVNPSDRDAGQQRPYSPPPRTDIGSNSLNNTINTTTNQDSKTDQDSDDPSEPTVSSLTNILNTNLDSEARMDAMEELAVDGGLELIPTLQQVASSDSDPDIRERAKEMIEDIRDEFSQ